MADKKNLCAQIDTALHARVRQEQEQSGKTLSEYVEQLIQNYYNMKENIKMTGDMRTMAIQLPEELFERLKAYLKKNGLKQKQFIGFFCLRAAFAVCLRCGIFFILR